LESLSITQAQVPEFDSLWRLMPSWENQLTENILQSFKQEFVACEMPLVTSE
jgi:hypothetical protein